MKKAAAMNMKMRTIWIIMWAVVVVAITIAMGVNILSGRKEINQAKSSCEFSDTKWTKKNLKETTLKN